MKKALFHILGLSLVLCSTAMAQETVPITSFENSDEFIWEFSGGMAAASFADTFFEDDGVVPQDGDWHMIIDYDTELSLWGNMNLNFPDGTRDISGMREIHFWSYFPEDALPHQSGEHRFRVSLGNGRELGTQGRPAEELTGEWVEWVFLIDSNMMIGNDPAGTLVELSQFQLRVNPGGTAGEVFGTVFIDNIFAVRPADYPDELEEIQIWSFDQDTDGDFAPDGWEANGGEPFLGLGDIPPSEGENFMELALGDGWTQNGQGVDAKERTDRLAEATDVLFDVYISEDFSGWLNLQLILKSGGQNDAGEDLSPTTGWDDYGERNIGSWEKGVWHTISFPVDMENHMGALEDPNGWFQVAFTTNQPGDQAGKLLFIDNFRILVPAQTADLGNWALF